MLSNTTASYNTAVGYQAGYSNTTGENIAAFGYWALKANTTGRNTGIGPYALATNTTGTNNNAFGDSALYLNTEGNNNTAVGFGALLYNTTADNNTAVGYQAGYSNTEGAANTAVGNLALFSNTTGTNNTVVGSRAGATLTTGTYNTFIGSGSTDGSGFAVTTGSKNTILGGYTGNNGGLDIRTSNNNIVLSDGDGNPRLWGNYLGNFMMGGLQELGTTVLNINGVTSAVNGIGVKNSSDTGTIFSFFVMNTSNSVIGSITNNGASTSYNTSSDYRLKENVVPLAGAADRLAQLPVHQFNFINTPDKTVDGFLAHEVQDIVPEAIVGTKDAVDADGNPVYQGIDQSKLVPLLTAALQEALTEIASLKARLDAANL